MTDLERNKERNKAFMDWLVTTKHNLPPFDPSETRLVWSKQDAWARHPETQRWWFLAVDRPGREWVESIKTCSIYDLS